MPTSQQKMFEDLAGYMHEYRGPANPQSSSEEPFATDAEAVDAARAWIHAHFGVPSPEVTLQPTRIDRTTQGHRIQLMQCYNGLLTNDGADVELNGRRVSSASLRLFSFTPVAGSAKRCVSGDEAVAAWRKAFESKGLTPEALARFDREAKARLMLIWSPAANRGSSRDRVVPTWSIEEEHLYLVDGHSGKSWVND